MSYAGRYLPYDCQLLPGSHYYHHNNNINNNNNDNDNNNSPSSHEQQQQQQQQQQQLMMQQEQQQQQQYHEGLLRDRHVLFLGDSTLLIMFKAIINKLWGDRDVFLSENNSPQWQVSRWFIYTRCLCSFVTYDVTFVTHNDVTLVDVIHNLSLIMMWNLMIVFNDQNNTRLYGLDTRTANRWFDIHHHHHHRSQQQQQQQQQMGMGMMRPEEGGTGSSPVYPRFSFM